jgi:hypothetical protein
VGKYEAFDMSVHAFVKRLVPSVKTGRQDWAEPAALLFLDQIKREKGVWWMPWQ